jgi:hypothetical protein
VRRSAADCATAVRALGGGVRRTLRDSRTTPRVRRTYAVRHGRCDVARHGRFRLPRPAACQSAPPSPPSALPRPSPARAPSLQANRSGTAAHSARRHAASNAGAHPRVTAQQGAPRCDGPVWPHARARTGHDAESAARSTSQSPPAAGGAPLRSVGERRTGSRRSRSAWRRRAAAWRASKPAAQTRQTRPERGASGRACVCVREHARGFGFR